jgi:hypothetical protein
MKTKLSNLKQAQQKDSAILQLLFIKLENDLNSIGN